MPKPFKCTWGRMIRVEVIHHEDHTELVYEHDFPEDKLQIAERVLKCAHRRINTAEVTTGKLTFTVKHDNVEKREGESGEAYRKRRRRSIHSTAIHALKCIGLKARKQQRRKSWAPPLTVKRRPRTVRC